MNSYNELITLIDAVINRNGVQAITGQVLNGVLKAMVQQLGAGYSLGGVAKPTDDPGTPEAPVCYFASEVGTYTNFGGVSIVAGELALLCYDMTDGWFKETMYEGFASVGATIDGNVGTPAVDVTYNNGILSFDFRNMKGNPGQDGAAAGFGTIGATIDGNVGTPAVSVQESGPNTAKNLQFNFSNLKGETGVTSVVVTVDNTSGTPQCAVSLSGQVLTLAFTGLKGAQGDTGSSVDYPFTIVNNLTTNDATQALSAAQGVVLEGEISQLEAIVDGLPAHTENILNVTGSIGSSIFFVSNPLLEGDSFTLYLNLVNANWTRFAFSKVNTGSDMATLNNNGDLYFLRQTNNTNGYTTTDVAPNPTTYPYLAYQKPNASNSIVLDKNVPKGEGLDDDVEDLQTRMMAAEGNITNISGDVADLEDDVNGIPAEVELNTSALVSDITYAANPLLEGDAFTLELILGAANWTRFAFSKNNTGTDWNTEDGNGNLYFWRQTNTVGTYTGKGTAPNPSVYPYLMYQKPSTSNEIKLTKDAIKGLADRVADIEDGGVVKQAQLAQDSTLNDVSGAVTSGYNRYLIFEKPLIPRTEYKFTIDLSEETAANVGKLAHIYLLSNRISNTQVGDIVSQYNKSAGGSQSFNVTPTDFVVAVNIIFQNTYSISGAVLGVKTEYIRAKYGDYDNEVSLLGNSMVGKTVLMLGDSITQLPYTGFTADGLAGMGIVEYSAIKLGANVIRGAFGGSHLARRSATKPSSVTTDGDARALLDVPSIVESLVSGDWTLQESAAAFTGVDASWAKIVETLSDLDMSEVDVVTIFAGTNDMNGNAPLGDTDSINPYYVNGAVNYIAKIFCTAFPGVQLLFYTPCYRKFSSDWEDDSDYAESHENTLHLTLYDYADAIVARAKENALPVCNMLETMGWNKYNYHAFCNDDDATHPRKGFQHLATRICGFLLSHQNRY